MINAAEDDAASRLHAARTLRCTFRASVATWIKSGHRTVEQSRDKSSATYDDINVTKGTARIIGNIGASDLTVWLEHTWGSLWMLERAPSGNVVVTTIFPMYAEGTHDLVALESRHSMAGQSALGEESYGTCEVLE